MPEINKRAILHPQRGIWYWYRWKMSSNKRLNDYMAQWQDKTFEYATWGKLEFFEKLNLKKVPSVLPEMVKMALADPKLQGVSNHTKVQKFLLEHDPFTVAAELPLSSPKRGVTGFIDIVRVLDDRIEILDYKPPGTNKGVEKQLQRYRVLLNDEIKHPHILVGWFNQNVMWLEEREPLAP